MAELWQEYEEGKSLESQFVHDVDKIELLLQMVEYERRAAGSVDLGEFSRVATRIELAEMRTWAADIFREREELWKAFGKEPTEIAIARRVIRDVEEWKDNV